MFKATLEAMYPRFYLGYIVKKKIVFIYMIDCVSVVSLWMYAIRLLLLRIV